MNAAITIMSRCDVGAAALFVAALIVLGTHCNLRMLKIVDLHFLAPPRFLRE